MKTLRIILTLLVAGISIAAAQVPQLISYQGRITSDGINFDGTGFFKFAMVSGDGSTTYWSNDASSVGGSEPTAAVTLSVTKGLYSVFLGETPDMMEITPEVFAHPDMRLRVWFSDGGLDGSQLLSPDQRVASVAYAMIAGTVSDGAITSEKIAAGAVGPEQLAPGSVTPAAMGTGSISGTLSCLGADLGDATILIAGRSIQATAGAAEAGGHPYDLSPVPAGTHTVKARLESGDSQTVQITITAGEVKTAVDFDFPELHKQWYRDADGDGFGNSNVVVTACFEPSVVEGETGAWVLNANDCDDTNPMVHPGAQEFCNGIDDDCDGETDENAVDAVTWYQDADADGFGNSNITVLACEQPHGGFWAMNGDDCDDTTSSTYPGALELCDGQDNNCNGFVDEGGVCCGDGILNGFETDLDCGGPECSSCADGEQCDLGSDCESGLCEANVCVAVCVPLTCGELGKNCGIVSDGCGGFLECGTCGFGNSCVDNICQ